MRIDTLGRTVFNVKSTHMYIADSNADHVQTSTAYSAGSFPLDVLGVQGRDWYTSVSSLFYLSTKVRIYARL